MFPPTISAEEASERLRTMPLPGAVFDAADEKTRNPAADNGFSSVTDENPVVWSNTVANYDMLKEG